MPFVGARSLAEHDRRWVERRLLRLVLEMAAVMVFVAAVVALSIVMLPRAPAVSRMLHGELGVGLVATGAVGVLGCLTARGWWRRLALIGAGYLVGALAADLWLPTLDQPRWLTAEVLVATTVLGLSFLGLAFARRVRLLWLAPKIRADLAEGMLERFEGRPSDPLDRTIARLHAGTGASARVDFTRLEVLPRSGVVVRVAGRRVERWEAAHVAQVAPAQPHALRVDLPQGVAPTAPDPRMCLKRRSLTPHERAELSRHIDRLRRRRWPVVVLTVVVLGLVGWDLSSAVPDRTLPLDGVSLGWLALLVVVYIGYGRRMIAARKLEHDRRLRWVVTVHQEAADPHCDPPSLEVLPISQLAWTERASPAGWRVSRL